MNKLIIKALLTISLLILLYSCDQEKELVVEPINEAFNNEYLTGKGLDTNYFNTKDVMQYYQVSNYNGLTAHQILAKLDSFSRANFPPLKLNHIQTISLLFYKKKLFVDYNENLYESARDNDNRRLSDHSKELLASITIERINNDPTRMLLKKILYDNGKPQLKLIDHIQQR